MPEQTHSPSFPSLFEEEVRKIARFYRMPWTQISEAVGPLMPFFEKYWEMVFSKEGFELITAGNGEGFGALIMPVAESQGLSVGTVERFDSCSKAFPAAIQGIKLCFSDKAALEPTLYVRTKSEKERVFAHLATYLSSPEIGLLRDSLRGNEVVYGLGFSERQQEPYLKTYSIQPVEDGPRSEVMGFVSHRLHRQEISQEHETYLPEVALRDFVSHDPDLEALLEFLAGEMRYSTAGHIGHLHRAGKATETKVYVERVGGIPTDSDAR